MSGTTATLTPQAGFGVLEPLPVVEGYRVAGTIESIAHPAGEGIPLSADDAPLMAAPRRLRRHPRLMTMLLKPCLITSGWLEALYTIADGGEVDLSALPGASRSEAWQRGDVLALERQPGTQMPGSRLTTIREGIATISITGPIIRHADMFMEMSGAVSLQAISRDFHRALADQDVRGILLNIDSPGGEASDIDEFAAMVASARGVKPIHAYVGDLMASAAYWIGSAASKITASRTASLGSIGTVAIVPRKDADGPIEIVSSQSPKKRLDPESEEGAASIQTLVDGLSEIFIESVAVNRGVTTAKVEQDFGQGGILLGKRAVKAGLADEVGSYESAFRALVRETERAQKAMTKTSADEIVAANVEAVEETPITASGDTPEMVALRDQIAKMTAENARLLTEQREQQTQALRERLTTTFKAENWAGADADNLLVAEALIASHGGEHGTVYQAFVRSMKASANQDTIAKLAEPLGVGGVEVSQGVLTELQARTGVLMAANPGLTLEQAQNKLFGEDRDLEARYGAYVAKLNGKR